MIADQVNIAKAIAKAEMKLLADQVNAAKAIAKAWVGDCKT